MSFYKFLFTIVIVALLSTCAEKPTEVKSTGEVQGRVLDIKTGAGIENATVTIPTISDKLTDISGFYQFKDIEEGTYSLVAEKTGYVSEIKQIVIEVNETKEVNFQLMKDEPALSITPPQINFGTIETIQTVSITNTGTGSLTWSASENINWLSLSPTTGSITADDTIYSTISVIRAGLPQGNYEGVITFASNAGNDTLQVQMDVVPTLVVSESSLDFGTELTALTLTVTNLGGGDLEWAAASAANWLTISPTSGSTQTEDDVITLLVDRTGLDGGDYSTAVTFTSNGGNYTVSVTMRVPLPPELSVSPTSLNFGASTSTMNLNISNNGDGVLNWSVAADQGWITASPTSGETTTETGQVAIIVDRNGLEVGDYSGSITITTNGGNATIPITLNVVPGPTLSVTPSSLDFSASQSSMTFTITNVGTQTLEWNISDDQDWISVSPTSGSTTTEQDIVTVTVDRNGLAAGDYSGSVTVTSNGGDQVVAVSMEILPPILVVSSSFLDFGENETSLQLTIDNGGDDELSWQVSSDQSWLTTFPTTGTTTSETDEITVSVNRSLLEVGNYTANLFFTSNGGNVSVPVAMEVTPVGLILSENSLDFGEETTQLSFVISNSGNGELNWSLTAIDSWITANPTSGTITTNTENITVNVSRSGLSPNTYTGSISIDSNGGNQSVSVTMIVPEGPSPTISVNPSTLDFGSSETQLSFTISNVGEETLNWSISADQSWISLWPSSGSTSTEEDEISVTVDRTGLSYGAYSGELNITSDGGDETISVNMDVPFFEDFADLNDWSNDGWTVSNSNNCSDPPCALSYTGIEGYNYINPEMSINVNVTDGQILSFWAYVYSPSGVVELFFNNVLVWSKSGYGTETSSVGISGSGNLNIKFKGSGPEYSSVYIDNLSIE